MIYTVLGLGLVLCGLALAGILGVLAVRPPRAPSPDEDAEIAALERVSLRATWRAHQERTLLRIARGPRFTRYDWTRVDNTHPN